MKKLFPIVALLVLFTLTGCVTNIPAEGTAIRQNMVTGSLSSNSMDAGYVLNIPGVHRLYNYDLAMNQLNLENENAIIGISKDGLTVGLDINVQYRYRRTEVPYYVSNYGEQTRINSLFYQRVRNSAYEVLRQHNADELYGEKSQEIQAEIKESLRPRAEELKIDLDNVLLKRVVLPPTLKKAIEFKLEADQKQQQMDFDILREIKEKERRIIEAEGIAKANEIIAESITTNYLRYFWIEHLGTDSEVYYVPVGPDGLPLFKSVD